MSGKVEAPTSLPVVNAAMFVELGFEEKYKLYASSKFGFAGMELKRGYPITDKDLCRILLEKEVCGVVF